MDEDLSTPIESGQAGPTGPLAIRRSTRLRLEREGLDFLVNILSREVARRPTNAPALSELAHLYTRLGRLEEGLRVDQALVRLVPDDPTVHYNLACSHALMGQLDPALDALEAAIQRGYDDADHMAADEDLSALHADPRFRALLRLLETE